MRRAFLLLLLVGCSNAKFGRVMGSGVSTGAGVATATAVAVAASAGSKALGGCYAICQQGEVCNARSGLCEVLPCHGLCSAGEKCDEGFFGDKCVASDGQSVTARTATPASGLDTGAIRIENKPDDVKPPVPRDAMP
jgi:hypothetical protein